MTKKVIVQTWVYLALVLKLIFIFLLKSEINMYYLTSTYVSCHKLLGANLL